MLRQSRSGGRSSQRGLTESLRWARAMQQQDREPGLRRPVPRAPVNRPVQPVNQVRLWSGPTDLANHEPQQRTSEIDIAVVDRTQTRPQPPVSPVGAPAWPVARVRITVTSGIGALGPRPRLPDREHTGEEHGRDPLPQTGSDAPDALALAVFTLARKDERQGERRGRLQQLAEHVHGDHRDPGSTSCPCAPPTPACCRRP